MHFDRAMGRRGRRSTHRDQRAGYHPAPTRKLTGMFVLTSGSGVERSSDDRSGERSKRKLLNNMDISTIWNGGTVERSRARMWRVRARENYYACACVRVNHHRSIVPPFQRVILNSLFNWLGVERRVERWNGRAFQPAFNLGFAVKNWGETR
ncbi:hypothetical protein [Hyphomicrobium sp. DY-1]|uniref:hypothetical protein n=1 Tax=Hyphomicrobium sp. DY-1 TaxID=3075650 RepID=UPI0039C3901F